MKYFALLALTLLMTKSLVFSVDFTQDCGFPEPCADQSCCACRQDPNDSDGNGYLEFDSSCLSGGVHCVNVSGCRLCYKPIFGSTNLGNRPVCARFSGLGDVCQNEGCCLSHQNPNPADGNGYLEFNQDCLDGGLHCVANTGCQLCYNPVVGGSNIGERPVCGRFSDLQVCNDQNCCENRQNPNPTDGNGYQEFNPSCLNGGLNCIANTGCQYCYKPVLGGANVGERPICTRFTNTTGCNSEDCCISRQNPNENDGNSFLEFNPSCLNGGLNCIENTGCQLCYKNVPQGVNVGERPVCRRFADSSICNSEECCVDRQNPNPTDGNSYLEFVQSCLDGGLNCVDKTGCSLCYRPVIGSTNVGNRPICSRFSGINGQICNNQICCENYQSPNPNNGNGYYEFNPSCLSGGLNCIADSGCQLCYKPIFGSINVGNRPVCSRFTNIIESAICNDDNCCISHQLPNSADGNGYLEFNATCLVGGTNCVATSGCQLCYNPVEGGVNLGSRPTCARF